jgi:hypothetical protein
MAQQALSVWLAESSILDSDQDDVPHPDHFLPVSLSHRTEN